MEFDLRACGLPLGQSRSWKHLALSSLVRWSLFFSLSCWLSVSHGHSMPQAWGYFAVLAISLWASPVLILHPTTQLCHELISNSSGFLAACFLNAVCFSTVRKSPKPLAGIEATKSQTMASPLCFLATLPCPYVACSESLLNQSHPPH